MLPAFNALRLCSRYNVIKGLDLKNGLKYSDRLEDEEIDDDYDTDDGNEYYDYDNGIYYYEDDYGNTWAKCENLYDLPDYKATDNDDSGITVFFAPKAEKLTAMEKEYTEALNDMYRAKLFVIVFGVIEFMLVCYLLLICAYNADIIESYWIIIAVIVKISAVVIIITSSYGHKIVGIKLFCHVILILRCIVIVVNYLS